MQTNEVQNGVIRYLWASDGTITEVECRTGGADAGEFNCRWGCRLTAS
jgi:hypothetical protein